MGSSSTILLKTQDLDEIAKETGFSNDQIKRLYDRFTSLDKENKGYLRRQDFLSVSESHVKDRLIEVILEDFGTDDHLTFKQFARLFTTFKRSKSKEADPSCKEKKLRFLFNIYDRDKDNCINKTELLSILNIIVGDNLPQEQMNAIAEQTIAELLTENDFAGNMITYEKFCDTLKKIDIEDKMSMKFLK